MLVEQTLFGERNKVDEAIERLRILEPDDGYWLAFSGGKDSVVVKALCEMANVKCEAHYSVTSVDPPELVQFIKEKHPDVSRDIPHDKDGKPITMWNLIPKKMMPPTRIIRYCCEALKESAGEHRLTLTGVRWAESVNRKNNQGVVTVFSTDVKSEGFVKNSKGGVILNNDNLDSREILESCGRWRKTVLNPIIDWSDEDVWEFIRKYNIPYCELYDKGHKRLGCIGCPMNPAAAADLEAYPKYKAAYLKAFDRMLHNIDAEAPDKRRPNWQTAEEVMDWWLHGDKMEKQIDGQLSMDIGGARMEVDEDG